MKQRSAASSPAQIRGFRHGLTLVELLVTLAIIVLLIALLLPAVQMSRESARKTVCRDNLRQLSLAIIEHESAFGVLPSDGWGWRWMGEPDRGTGQSQPGGWLFQILPYLERNDVHAIGSGLADPLRRLALGDASQVGIKIARCPSRASAENGPRDPITVWMNAELAPTLSRSDYVGNAGDFFYGVFNGPETLAEGDSPSFEWPSSEPMTGVLFLRSKVRMSDLVDGATATYLIGEKYVAKPHYFQYGDSGYDQSIQSGDDWDVVRWTNTAPLMDGIEVLPTRFGSAHSSVFHMSLCDGSVRSISYAIDPSIHKQLGNRNDQGPIADSF